MTDLDTRPHHPDTIARWDREYGPDMPDGSLVRWTQHGVSWCARRYDGAWFLVVEHEGRRGSSTRGHTWPMLCSRLERMAAQRPIERRLPHEWDPTDPTWAHLPARREPARHDRAPGPFIPRDRFPNIGAMA